MKKNSTESDKNEKKHPYPAKSVVDHERTITEYLIAEEFRREEMLQNAVRCSVAAADNETKREWRNRALTYHMIRFDEMFEEERAFYDDLLSDTIE